MAKKKETKYYRSSYHKVFFEAYPNLARIDSKGFTTTPSGYDIHHKNFNHYDDDLENLELIRREEHKKLHADHQRTTKPRSKKIESNSGKNGYQWIEPTQDMIESILNGITRQKFCENFDVSRRIWEKIRNVYLTKDQQSNLRRDGEGFTHSEEVRKKRSEALKNSEKMKAYAERKSRPIDPEMIDDVKKGMSQTKFKKKYECFASVWYRAKEHLV